MSPLGRETTTPVAAGVAPALRPVRVMVADDSVVARGLMSRWVEGAGGFEIVGCVADGRAAVDLARRAQPDIVLLDLDMPVMEGTEALPLILKAAPGVSVIVVSTLTQRNADVSLRCLAVGAADYQPKPGTQRELTTSLDFRRELLAKLEGLSVRHRRMSGMSAAPRAAGDQLAVRSPASPPRRFATRPRAVLIGASTGGPRAIIDLLKTMPRRITETMPILVVQHMPAIFTTVFAEHVRAETGLAAREGRDGERLAPGLVYVAPGARHMGLTRIGSDAAIRLDDGPPLQHCRPAVDILFGDAADVFGAATVAVVLTGMGSDGTRGAQALAAVGAPVIVQDEATSVVWGMPGSVAKAGLAHAVLPLRAIGGTLETLVAGRFG